MAGPEELSAARATYKIGQVLTLHRDPEWDADGPLNLRLRVVRLHQPWTLSCGMVVEILSDQPADSLSSSDKLGFLKLFDWRFAHQLRDDQGVGPWTDDAQTEYARFIKGGGFDDFLRRLREDETFRRETEDDWSDGENEAFLASEMLRMYNSEVAVYQRLRSVQGKLVPRLITASFLDTGSPNEVDDRDQTSFQIKGILLQYIRGFSLTSLDSQAPQSNWQDIVNQGVRIAHVLGDKEILNADVRPDNFIVNPIHEGKDTPCQHYRVFMIDFGQSRLRQEGESDFDWGRAKWQQDEEGAVGLVMQHRLRKLGVEISFCPSLRYLEFAEREDE